MNTKTNTFSSERSCLLALALVLGAGAAADEPHFYLGGSIGQSRATIAEQRIRNALVDGGFTVTSFSSDDDDIAYKLFGGYRFNDYLSLEGGYFDLGEFGFEARTIPLGRLTGDVGISGFNVDLVANLHFSQDWSMIGRLGYLKSDADVALRDAGFVTIVPGERNNSTSTTNYKAGLGVQWDLTPKFATRLEFERYRIGDALGNKGDVDALSLGVVYRFGGDGDGKRSDRPAAVHSTPSPAPVAVVVVPVAKQTARYCAILDMQFEINADQVQREEAERLAVVGTFMRDYPETTAVIQGHSDDVGSSVDNLALSLRRAESVVDYLVDSQRIARSRLSAIGYGEAYPVADNATPEGQRANRRIGAAIACANDLAGLKAVPARVTMALEIEFDPYKSNVLASSRDELRKVADFLKANPATTATVEGHASKFLGLGDDQTLVTPEAAMAISVKRAQNVVDYLATEFGIPRTRLSAQGFGQTRRVSYGTTLEDQQDNRRINVIINYPKK